MAHNNYYVDLTVGTFVVCGDKVLLRMHEKYHNWGSVGGHIDAGQDAVEAALREVWEEVGLEVKLVGPIGWKKEDTDTCVDLVPPHFYNRHKITPTHDHAEFIFFAESDSMEINPQTEADKGAKCIWLTKDELDALYKTDSRIRKEIYRYASEALRVVAVQRELGNK